MTSAVTFARSGGQYRPREADLSHGCTPYLARHETHQPAGGFDPRLWLSALTAIGGGYALISGRKLAFVVDDCDGEALTSVMAQIIGQPERQEAIKAVIERRQFGEAA